MHQLRKHILYKLIVAEQQRYAELKPAEVEGNLFTYHLNKLAKEGLIEKKDSQYTLTAAGQLYADKISLKTMAIRSQPKIVTLIAGRNSYGEYLLYKRGKQPLIGRVGFPYGKIHLGETVAEAAARELKEKTGLSASLSHRGEGYISTFKNEEPISQILFHLFIATDLTGELTEKSRDGTNFWGKPHFIPSYELLPGVIDILKILSENPVSRFFVELNYEL